jgi:hypothetical protein
VFAPSRLGFLTTFAVKAFSVHDLLLLADPSSNSAVALRYAQRAFETASDVFTIHDSLFALSHFPFAPDLSGTAPLLRCDGRVSMRKGRLTMDDRESDNQEREQGWQSTTAPSGEEALKTEERSLDVGESGQFAPGGYYNQQGVTAPDRSALDPDNKDDKF